MLRTALFSSFRGRSGGPPASLERLSDCTPKSLGEIAGVSSGRDRLAPTPNSCCERLAGLGLVSYPSPAGLALDRVKVARPQPLLLTTCCNALLLTLLSRFHPHPLRRANL